MSEYYCSHQPPCCPQVKYLTAERNALRAELQKATSDHCMDVFIPIEKYDAMQAEISRLKAERDETNAKDSYVINNLAADRDRWKSIAEKAREALEKINKVGLDRELGQIVGSEHYEKAWLDCVELAGRALALFPSKS